MYNYLALGDSITVGVGAPQRLGYADMVASYLQSTYPLVYTKKIARNGWRSEDLLTALHRSTTNQQSISTANLITLYIGGNDLSFAFIKSRLSRNSRPLYAALRRFYIQFNQLIHILRTHSRATLITATLYNPFPNSLISQQFIPQLNQAILSIAQMHSVPVANVFEAFQGKESALVDGYCDGRVESFVPLLQKNPIHPNQCGHKVIADCFWHVLVEQTMHRPIVSPIVG